MAPFSGYFKLNQKAACGVSHNQGLKVLELTLPGCIQAKENQITGDNRRLTATEPTQRGKTQIRVKSTALCYCGEIGGVILTVNYRQ